MNFETSPRRGFIGPLGDDIPSLFPIIFGILLFIGALAYASNALAVKSSALDVRKAAVELAYLVTERGELTLDEINPGATAGGAINPNSKCEPVIQPFAESHHVKVRVTLKRYCDYVSLTSDPYEKDTTVGSTSYEGAVCDTSVDSEHPSGAKPSNAVVLNYPVSVPCPGASDFRRGFGMVNVIVWR